MWTPSDEIQVAEILRVDQVLMGRVYARLGLKLLLEIMNGVAACHIQSDDLGHGNLYEDLHLFTVNLARAETATELRVVKTMNKTNNWIVALAARETASSLTHGRKSRPNASANRDSKSGLRKKKLNG